MSIVNTIVKVFVKIVAKYSFKASVKGKCVLLLRTIGNKQSRWFLFCRVFKSFPARMCRLQAMQDAQVRLAGIMLHEQTNGCYRNYVESLAIVNESEQTNTALFPLEGIKGCLDKYIIINPPHPLILKKEININKCRKVFTNGDQQTNKPTESK